MNEWGKEREGAHHNDRPWEDVARSVFYLPELRAKHLAQCVSNEEDRIHCHFLRRQSSQLVLVYGVIQLLYLCVTGVDNGAFAKHHYESQAAGREEVDAEQQRSLRTVRQGDQQDTRDHRRYECNGAYRQP